MEVRRIQVTGGSSYIITLPKEWIRNLNIQKNDPIGLYMQSNGTILITPKISQEKTPFTKKLKIKNSIDGEDFLRKLIGAYIAGFNSIKVQVDSKRRISPKVRDTVRKFTQTTIGQEVVEETNHSITIKDLLDPAEMPFKKTIKRMHMIVKSMYEDIMEALKNKDKKLAEDVISRDNEIDRLHWLIARQYNIILRNVNFAEKMNTTTELASTSFLISRIIERIGDHVIRIAENVISILNKDIGEKITSELEKASKLSLDIFFNSIGSFFRKNIDEANENISKVEQLVKKCKKINAMALKEKGATAISLGYIVESTRRIGEYSEDICENVVNHYVRKEK